MAVVAADDDELAESGYEKQDQEQLLLLCPSLDSFGPLHDERMGGKV